MPATTTTERFMSDYLQIQLAGLAFRAVPGANSAVRLRAATWHNLLHRLGVHLPYVIVHDLGQIFCYNASETGQIGLDEAALQNAGTHPDFKRMVGDYVQLVDRLSQSEVVHRARGWRLGDDVIAVLLAKVLMVVFRDWPEARKKAYLRERMPMDADEYEYTYLRHNLGDDDWQ